MESLLVIVTDRPGRPTWLDFYPIIRQNSHKF